MIVSTGGGVKPSSWCRVSGFITVEGMGTLTRSAASQNPHGDLPTFVYRGRAIVHVTAAGRSTFVSRAATGYRPHQYGPSTREDEELLLLG